MQQLKHSSSPVPDPGKLARKPARNTKTDLENINNMRSGYLYGAASYLIWGFFPLFFALLAPAGALEIIAHRIWWSLVFALLLIFFTHRARSLYRVISSPRSLGFLATAGCLQAANWTIYVWAVLNGHVLEASLGYFINPLVTVLLAVIFLGEKLSGLQVSSLIVAFIAVIFFVVDAGTWPWVAFALAFTFGFYSLVKKKLGPGLGPLPGLAVESAVTSPFALGYLGFLWFSGQSSWHTLSVGGASAGQMFGHITLLVTAGIVTLIPLIFFAQSARIIPLSALGMLQYLGPAIQFLLGWLVFHEALSLWRWLGFGLIWLSIALLSIHIVSHTHHRR